MYKRIILLMIVILLLLTAGALVLRERNLQSSRSLPEPIISKTPLPMEVTVHLTSKGFKPQDVEIRPSTAVRWVKDIPARASVNSDDYPLNRKYPELNLGEFGIGSTLIHIFEQKGVYTYHDQFNPSFKGKITVETDE